MRREALERNLRTMAAVRFAFWLHFMASVLIPFFRDWAGLSYTWILGLNSWFMLCNFALEVPTGAVADRFGRRRSLALGGFVAAGAGVLYASAPELPRFLVAELLFAVAYTLMSGADEALVYDTLKALDRAEEATRRIARLESWKLAGIVTGALLGSPIAATFGLRAPMLFQAVPALIAGLLALTLTEPPHAESEPRAARLRDTLLEGVRHVRAQPVLRALVVDLVGCVSVCWVLIWLYQAALERAGVALPYYGLVHAAMTFAQIALLWNLGRVESWLGGRRRLLRIGAVVPALAYLVLGTTERAVPVIAAIVVCAGFGLSRPAVFSGLLNRHIPSAQRATALSAVSMLRTLVLALVNPLAGLVADRSLSAAFLAAGVAGLAAAWLAAADAETLAE